VRFPKKERNKMPVYSYECQRCGLKFDKTRPIKEGGYPAECLKCPGMGRRVIEKVAVIFKGKGFYTTDNKKEISN
jgi:putative FmdB family regulatory protein